MVRFFFFFKNTNIQQHVNSKLVRVAELLIYSHTPSKLGDVGQNPHTVFFFFLAHKYTKTHQLQGS